MPKRNLYAELTEGFDALAAARKGKKTLRTTEVTLKPVVEVSADELRAIREKLNLSRPVFASVVPTPWQILPTADPTGGTRHVRRLS